MLKSTKNLVRANVNTFLKATRFSEISSSCTVYRRDMQSKNNMLDMKFFLVILYFYIYKKVKWGIGYLGKRFLIIFIMIHFFFYE